MKSTNEMKRVAERMKSTKEMKPLAKDFRKTNLRNRSIKNLFGNPIEWK